MLLGTPPAIGELRGVASIADSTGGVRVEIRAIHEGVVLVITYPRSGQTVHLLMDGEGVQVFATPVRQTA